MDLMERTPKCFWGTENPVSGFSVTIFMGYREQERVAEKPDMGLRNYDPT